MIGACRVGVESLPSRVPRDFGWRCGSQFRLVVLVQGARTTGLLVDAVLRSVEMGLARCGSVRDRPQGGRSWGPPQPPNDRR